MLIYFLRNMDQMEMWDVVYMVLAYGVILFLTLPVHELAHGLVAHWCGDDTAKWHGRLSLNPFRHLDLWGTLMILTVGIGYAKPVPINPGKFRKYKRDTILVSLAGPLSNFLMALVAMLLLRICGYLVVDPIPFEIIYFVLSIIISVNISLMVFNLMPIPPLDGSRLWSTLLPGRWAFFIEQNSRYFTMGLFILLAVGALDLPLSWLNNAVYFLLNFITDLPFRLIEMFI